MNTDVSACAKLYETGYDTPSVLYEIGRQMLDCGAAVVIGWAVWCLQYQCVGVANRLY